MNETKNIMTIQLAFLLLCYGIISLLGCGQTDLWVSFAERRGQIEVGGTYVGMAFHHSRPIPSRISFYYPVANSIDLSHDYWKRDESLPFRVTISHNGVTDSLARESYPYRYTPFSLQFAEDKPDYRVSVDYWFCKNLPVMVWQLEIVNRTRHEQYFNISTELVPVLRPCQTYGWCHPQQIDVEVQSSTKTATVYYRTIDTDSAVVFVICLEDSLIAGKSDSSVKFLYAKQLKPKQRWRIRQLVGSCKEQERAFVFQQALHHYQQEVRQQQQTIVAYAMDSLFFRLPDDALLRTARWARAVLLSNRHYLEGQIVPMPCPAEYNLFFTHDMLLTHLGAVNFDAARVRTDLLYLKTLTRADSVLPHAHYWRDGNYQTEFCSSDNWNHLWFILLCASYLRRTGDTATIETLLPLLEKSLQMLLQNKGEYDLMYAHQPDWWDIGHVYGARAYLTTMMVRALREYVFLGLHLQLPSQRLPWYLSQAERMQEQMGRRLWHESTGYLMNTIDSTEWDNHYYAGSLLSAAWGILDREKSYRLLQTAKEQLLDANLGIRIAMPADFHHLIDRYHFHGMEMGEPYVYLNGGIWPQGIIWYALGWLAISQVDSAEKILNVFMTLDGIRHSPNGQPAFFEYRRADPASPRYGEIDKPTFLWAGGWFLHALYQIAGLRENEWNLSFSAILPKDWRDIEFKIWAMGKRMKVRYNGEGKYFRKIKGDHRPLHSAVLFRPLHSLLFERGLPQTPYLQAVDAIVTDVRYDQPTKRLLIACRGLEGQRLKLQIISPFAPEPTNFQSSAIDWVEEDGIYQISMLHTLQSEEETIVLAFR